MEGECLNCGGFITKGVLRRLEDLVTWSPIIKLGKKVYSIVLLAKIIAEAVGARSICIESGYDEICGAVRIFR